MRKLLLASCFGVAAAFTAGYAVANEELIETIRRPEPVGDAGGQLRRYAVL